MLKILDLFPINVHWIIITQLLALLFTVTSLIFVQGGSMRYLINIWGINQK